MAEHNNRSSTPITAAIAQFRIVSLPPFPSLSRSPSTFYLLSPFSHYAAHPTHLAATLSPLRSQRSLRCYANYAKQTQFQNGQNDLNSLSHKVLRRKVCFSPPQKRTQTNPIYRGEAYGEAGTKPISPAGCPHFFRPKTIISMRNTS